MSRKHLPAAVLVSIGGRRLPHVALVLQWRRDYPNKLPPKLAAVASEMGKPPLALQKRSGF
jgi:hypothetical protein